MNPHTRPETTARRNASQSSPYHHGDLRRALVEAALALVTEEQDWGFSLREVARRAGVSHNAPYRHFPEKRDLLAALAVAGYEALRVKLVAAAETAEGPEDELVAIGVAYVQFGAENPARYRLIFGPDLLTGGLGMPASVAEAAQAAKAVLVDVIARGVQTERFAVSQDTQAERDRVVLTAWALVHGLTMLLIDGLAGPALPPAVSETVTRSLLDGIRKRP
ncbi:transcriptional regulator, TetR family [Acidocella aminolytica 101 = DSM 11237]|nr:transcriptional regulator [Acidocella aminolytica 101 = DSM 11237]SHF15138.1 transcriptional regulator, TetR family [Acidocella aminolytica 101 = DSM 11237]